jgi:hypothetical protein
MGLTSQESETLSDGSIVPKALGYTPVAPESATPTEKELNARLRFTEYLNQTPGFGADGYDDNSNNDREWFGLGYPYTLKPDALTQDFYNAGQTSYDLTSIPLTGDKNSIISVTVYPPTETQPNPVINQDIHDTSVTRQVISVEKYDVQMNGNNEYKLLLTDGASYQGRIAVIYTIDSADATNCELVKAKIENGSIVPLTLRSKISYRSLVPEFQSEVPNTLDVIYSAMVSTGALKDYRGDNDYVYITEAGLWSNSTYTDSGDNGLLAGYRLMPSDEEILPVATKQRIVFLFHLLFYQSSILGKG